MRYLFIQIIVTIQVVCVVQASNMAPLVRVYANGHLPIENVTVAVTNPNKDIGILITSIEFEDQLPELRYFYHGIYGLIEKEGANYEHNANHQQLSMPVGSCFLLPGQSTSWKRPLRFLDAGYQAAISWQEISKDDIITSVWFQSESKNTGIDIYRNLSEDNQAIYSNAAAAKTNLPYVIVNKNFQSHSATVQVSCLKTAVSLQDFNKPIEGFPKDSIQFSLSPIAESVVLTEGRVVFRQYDMPHKKYITVASPDLKPPAVDFIFLCSRTEKKTIPCMLPPQDFNDLIEVQRPYTRMYFNAGITQVPIKLFSKILARAQERKLSVQLKRIDTNSLGRQYVLAIGIDVDENGRQPGSEPEDLLKPKKYRH